MQVGKTFTRKNTKASTWVQQTPTRMWNRGETSQSQCPHYRVTGWIYSCTTRPQHTSGQCPIKNSTAADSATLYLLGAKHFVGTNVPESSSRFLWKQQGGNCRPRRQNRIHVRKKKSSVVAFKQLVLRWRILVLPNFNKASKKNKRSRKILLKKRKRRAIIFNANTSTPASTNKAVIVRQY